MKKKKLEKAYSNLVYAYVELFIKHIQLEYKLKRQKFAKGGIIKGEL